jgi:molybdenum cofactor synthesis domain-containing protein
MRKAGKTVGRVTSRGEHGNFLIPSDGMPLTKTQRLQRVEALCSSPRKGMKKTSRRTVRFVRNHGIEGDAHAGEWHRQVSILDAADITRLQGKGLPDLRPGAFAENVILSGIDLTDIGLGSRLRIASDVELSVTQIGKVCHTRCAIFRKTGDCIMPRLGLFARVMQGGKVWPGDEAKILHLVPRSQFQAVVLTISDRCSKGEAEDTAGPAVCDQLQQKLAAHIYETKVLPDEQSQIAQYLRHYSDGHSIDLIVTVGGTGFSPRDVTPEAITEVITRPTPGLDEAMRRVSMKKTPHAMLSRSVSGINGSTLIVSLPGSKRGAVENLDAILPALTHGLSKLRGDQSDCDPARDGRKR